MKITFKYRNYKGSVGYRTIEVQSLDWIAAPGFDYQPGWFISGIDEEKKVRRSFALSHIVLEKNTATGLCLLLTPQ